MLPSVSGPWATMQMQCTPDQRLALRHRGSCSSGPSRHRVRRVPARAPTSWTRECVTAAGGDSPGPGSGGGPNLVDPVATIAWGGRLPPPRRIILSGVAATGIVLGGNLGGATTFLLGLDGGKLAQQLQLDVLFPIDSQPGPYKRCIDGTYGYEFTYPAAWLADVTVAYRAARRAEAARGLDPPPLSRARPGATAPYRSGPVFEPVAAYGPPGSTGEQNLSVIVAPIQPGFDLQGMGSPQQVAEQFLAQIVPPASSLEAQLFGSGSYSDSDGRIYYTMDYTVKGPKFYRHNLSVIAARGDQLFTFNAQCPEAIWQRDAAVLRAAAASFRLRRASGLDSTGFPGARG